VTDQLIGRKHLKFLRRHLQRLDKASSHPNRLLQYSDLLTLLLVGFFNPICRSLRSLEDYSQNPSLTGQLSIDKACRSTLSDANRCLDATLLEPLIEDLRRRLPDLPRTDRSLEKLLRQITIVDGSFFNVAADVAFALKRRPPGGEKDQRMVRLDLQYCCAGGVPECVAVHGKGVSETAFAMSKIEAETIYVADRGIFSYPYVRRIIDNDSDLVLRIKKSIDFVSTAERERSDQDRSAGVLGDFEGHLAEMPDLKLRLVVIADPNNPGHVVRLLTSLTRQPAHVIGQVYRWRWQIELFFRWLKVHAHFRHLMSHSQNGLTLGFHVAVIAVMLMYLHSGRKVSKYAYNLLTLVATGQATIEDILPILEARERERELDRQRLLRKRVQKTHG
jgi:hypothetical protein